MRIGDETGISYGTIQNTDVSFPYFWNGRLRTVRNSFRFTMTIRGLGGDSGGPVYIRSGNSLLLAGLYMGETTSNQGVFGYACRMSHIMNTLDVTPITNSMFSTTPLGGWNHGHFQVSGVFAPIATTHITILDVIDGGNVLALGHGSEVTGVFENLPNLTSVTLPNTLTNIGNSAFRRSSFRNITIPSSVRLIGADAFADMPNLESNNGVRFAPNNELVAIENNAFRNSGITNLNAPDSLGLIWENSFPENMTVNLRGMSFRNNVITSFSEPHGFNGEVNIPYGITAIGEGAFQNQSGITSISIPSTVTSIANNAFDGTINLEQMHISSANQHYFIQESILYRRGIPNQIVHVPARLSGHVTLPTQVTQIPANAFANRARLTSITMSDSVTYIGNNAFANTKLTSIILPRIVSHMGANVFANTSVDFMIFSRATSQPSGWHSNWNPLNRFVYFYSPQLPTRHGDFWRYVDGDMTPWYSFVVMFNVNSGGIDVGEYESQGVESGNFVIAPCDPQKPKFIFSHWACVVTGELFFWETTPITEHITLVAVWDSIFFAGNGTAANPFLIHTQEQLLIMTYLVNWHGWSYGVYFKQTSDIYLNDTTNWEEWEGLSLILCPWTWCCSLILQLWAPISTRENPFRGTFDGNGFAIRGLYIASIFQDIGRVEMGFFGVVSGGVINNVVIEKGFVFGSFSYTGAIVGHLKNGSVLQDSVNHINVNTIGVAVGGLVGRASNSYIFNSVNHGRVLSLTRLPLDKGGIVGIAYNSFIYGNTNYGDLLYNAIGSTGGIVGRLRGGVVENNTNYGYLLPPLCDEQCDWCGECDVIGEVGGIIGVVDMYGYSEILGNSHLGSIIGDSSSRIMGGIIGLVRSEGVVLGNNWFLSGDGINEGIDCVGGWDFGCDDWWCCDYWEYGCDCDDWWYCFGVMKKIVHAGNGCVSAIMMTATVITGFIVGAVNTSAVAITGGFLVVIIGSMAVIAAELL